MDMGTQGAGRKRLPNRERLTAEDEALNQIAREAEARLAAKRAARAEAREIRMRELERQQKEIYQVQKKYYGLDTKWGDIEQWMEDSERYSRRSRRNTSASDEDERMSVGSRGSLRTNGYDGELYGSQSLNRRSGRNSSYSGDSRSSTLSSSREEKLPSCLYSAAGPTGSYRVSVFDDSSLAGARRGSAYLSHAPSEHSSHLNSSSRASSRASSARASPVVEERPEKDFTEKGSRNLPSLSAATLASLGGTSSRRGSGDTSISIDTEASIREIKDSLAEVEEKYKKAMVSNAQLDNEKTNYMYQVDTLKDTLLELEEQLAESRRQYEEKSKEFEREKHAHGLLRFQFAEVRAALQQREEMLEKHGIILNSEIATNGEMSDTLNNVGHQGPTKMTKEELNALRTTGDGTLGKAITQVEVKKEVVENVREREILQNTEQEPRKEDPAKDHADTEVSPPGETEDRKPSGDSAPSLATLASATKEGHTQSQGLASTASLEQTEPAGSSEGVSAPDAGTGASLEQSTCSRELSRGTPGPVTGPGSGNALEIRNQSEGSVENQEQEKQGFKTSLGEASTRPHQESAPLQTPDAEAVSGSPGTVAAAGLNGFGEQEGTVASSPPRDSDDTVSHDKCVADVPKELDPSTGRGSEKELTSREAAEPGEVPVQSTEVGEEDDEEEEEGRGLRKEKPAQMEVGTGPSSPAAENSAQEATGLAAADAEGEPLEVPEPPEEKADQHGEGPASPQKKTKTKKKKNKKKKSPTPAEALKDVKKELTVQSSDPGGVKEEEGRVKLTDDTSSGGGAQKKGTGTPDRSAVAGSSGSPGSPEDPPVGWDGEVHQEEGEVNSEAGKGVADGEPAPSEGDTARASGSSAHADGLEEGVARDDADDAQGTSAAAPSAPAETEDVSIGAPLPNASPSGDTHAALQTEGPGSRATSEDPSPGARKAVESGSLENDALAPAGGLGDAHAESQGEKGGGGDKDKSKEDCTLS